MGRNEDLIKELKIELKEYKQKVNKAIIEFNSTKGIWLDHNIQREAFGKLLKDLKIEY